MSKLCDRIERCIERMIRPRGQQQGILIRPDLLAMLVFMSLWPVLLTVQIWVTILSRDSDPPPMHEQARIQDRE